MNVKTGVNIHNRFDIEVRDAVTGELKQEATGYNIILNTMWTRLVNFQSYFDNIHFGTGTGTLAATRTTLFTWLGQKTAVDDTLTKAIPVSSWKRKIVLNPEEYVGSVLTEVGISYSSTASSILTHALLKDSGGNTISITKLDTDVVTIYGTVFITFSTPDDTHIKFTGLPGTNPLINYLVGEASFPTCAFYFGECDGLPSTVGKIIGSKSLGTSTTIASGSWTKDVANKKTTTPALRVAITAGNGHVTEVGFGQTSTNPIFRSVFPITGTLTGQPYTNVPVATGDGVTTEFKIPSANINQDTIVMKVNGVTDGNFTKTLRNRRFNFDFIGADVAVPAFANGLAFCGNNVVAAAHNGPPYVTVYDFNGVNWIKRVNPTLIASSGQKCAFSADGSVMVVGHLDSPWLSCCIWDGSAWSTRTAPTWTMSLSGRVIATALSGDGTVWVVGTNATPYGATFKWNGSTWDRYDFAETTNNVTACTLSADGLLLGISCDNTPFVLTYDWNGTTWVKRPNPDILPVYNGRGVSFSADKLTMAVGCYSSPYIYVYDWNGSTWIKRPNPTALAPSNAYECALSSDGLAVFVSHDVSPFITGYDWVNSAWVKRDNPVTLPPYNGTCTRLSADNTILGVTSGLTPYLNLYDLKKRDTYVNFATPPGAGLPITADYTVNGIHKTDQYVVDISFSLQFGV